uniref:NYN domain-containing protein n=1 Tax=Tetranychus urticae TaxID=32264 RepID=T1KGH2_TETUR
MAKPCAVFWNIDNIDVPKGQSVDSVVSLIRSTIIKPYNLNEIFFFCVCDAHKLPSNVDHSMTNLDFQTYNGLKDSADNKMLELMRKFVQFSGQDCTIILLGGDAGYYDDLSDLKKLHNISIYLIGLDDSYSLILDEISDYTFKLNDGVLEPVKSTVAPMYFISVTNYSVNNIKQVMTDLNNLYIGSSAILYDCSICIGFATLFNAIKPIKQLNGAGYYDTILKAEFILDSPLIEILKSIKPTVDMQTISKEEVKKLTFIKMNISNEADDSKIKFCIACSEQSGSQCILSMKPYLWIVFSFESHAQKFLPKVKIIYPDAVISEPPIDLTLKLDENTYSVESFDVIDTNREPSSVVTLQACDDIDWNIFFRFNCDFIAPMPYYEPTKWSLLYNLFEKIYDLGAKKVIFDGNLYCAHFDSASAYQDALAQMRSLYLEPLEYVLVPETQKLKAAKKMTRYPGIPWCLNEQLDLSCLVIKIESQLHNHFVDIGKNILGNRECIFIKSISGEIWIGFPDEHLCENSEKTVKRFLATLEQKNDVSMAKPSNELLESINFRDLAGDAYDLAFLSSQLEGSKPIKRPNIIERIRLQRMQEQECNESVFYFVVCGKFDSLNSFPGLAVEQTVKMVVKFSKVIPLAVTVFMPEYVNLMYNSWHEAHVAQHFIKKLTAAEVPYFREFRVTSIVQQQPFVYFNYSEYYIINDKRKVLEKIVQSKNQAEKLDSNSSSFQSIVKQLQYLYIIKTNSDFDFTSGMISITKLNLIQMDCPVCIEFDDKIWVAVDELEKGKKAKARIDQIKFKMLHEYEDDFQVEVVMESIQTSPTKVASMLADKFMNPKKNTRNICLNSDPFPLGHFNYSYRKAVGMSTSRYCQLNV